MRQSQARRYARQIQLPEFGVAGQARLLKASVLIVGVGGLGSPAALYLASAGIGRLGLMDSDKLALHNLQRQILYSTSDVNHLKVNAAKKRLAAVNPEIRIAAYPERLNAANASKFVSDYDVVLDGTDTFAAKFLIAAACHASGTPYVYGGVLGFKGQAMTVQPEQTACLRCLFDQPLKTMPRRGKIQGPLGPVPGLIGSVQAIETIKLVTGMGRLLVNRLLVFDGLTMDLRVLELRRNKVCPLCGCKKHPRLLRLKNAALK